MKWEEVEIGQLVQLLNGTRKGHTDYIGYIYKLDETDKTVKVNWSISMCDWEQPKDLYLVEVNDDLGFAEGLLETLKTGIGVAK